MHRLLPVLLMSALVACDADDPPSPQPRLQTVEYGSWSPRSFIDAVQRDDAEIWSIVGIEPIIADDLRAYDLDFDCDGWIDTVIALHSRGRIDWVVARQHPPRSWRIVSQFEQTLDHSEMDEWWFAFRLSLATVNGARFLTIQHYAVPPSTRVFEINDGQLRSVPDATNHPALEWRHRRAPCAPPQDLPATHPAAIAYALREGAPRDEHRAVWARIGVDAGDAQLGVQFSEIRAHVHYVNLNDDANPDAIVTLHASGSEAAWLIFEQTADAA